MSLNQEFRADLHCHTTCSDGSMTPKEVLRLAKDVGLKGISITDHDSIEAYTEAVPKAQLLGLEIIPGVEFSSHYGETSVHILGYAFSLDSPAIHVFCDKHTQRRTHRNKAILEKLAQHRMLINEEDLVINPNEPTHTIGRPHIAQALVRKGYCRTIRDAFNEYIGEGKPCFESGARFSVEETLQVIHDAGGLAVIAHPHLMDDAKEVETILDFPFDGVEVFYARFTERDTKKWLEIAEKRNLLITGGSDFHGSIKPNIALGSSWAPESTFRVLQKHYEAIQRN